MSVENKKDDPDVLLEKVREIEEQKLRMRQEAENTAEILNENRRLGPVLEDNEARRQMRNYSRRGFLIGGAAVVGAYLGYRWISDPENGAIFSKTFKVNEDISQAFYSPKSLAPEFALSAAREPRINGVLGLSEGFDPAGWKLNVLGVAGPENYPQYRSGESAISLTLDDIKALPKVEMTAELKCIEGWSVVVNWAGVRFSDFAAKFRPGFSRYVSIVTPDGGYYVGWDMPSILHPQTLLAYEMNGAPLSIEHGAPLRLVSTSKYGIKQIKRIGTIEFTDIRPRDYWAEEGYDWYSGH
ncbi:MAG TPA: molybdopterin-dependent oxidoreductase [Pyrinomonadaceae bacterium]|nr:molybdopterin-dependent oxidoreductase [Pyrinomonadaceae bacterium]